MNILMTFIVNFLFALLPATVTDHRSNAGGRPTLRLSVGNEAAWTNQPKGLEDDVTLEKVSNEDSNSPTVIVIVQKNSEESSEENNDNQNDFESINVNNKLNTDQSSGEKSIEHKGFQINVKKYNKPDDFKTVGLGQQTGSDDLNFKFDDQPALRSIWKGCVKKAAKACSKACIRASKSACATYRCRKGLKSTLKKRCKENCKSTFKD